MLARKIDFDLPVNDRESPVRNPGSGTDPQYLSSTNEVTGM